VGAISSAEEAATWAHRVMGTKNTLTAADAERVERAFHARLAIVAGPPTEEAEPAVRRPSGGKKRSRTAAVDKSVLALPAPRRIRDRDHVKSVAMQACLVCGRRPADAHHLRFAQSPALGRKVSDEFIVPLCRGHHREVHRSGNEADWWEKIGIDPTAAARVLWLKTHPLPTATGEVGPKLQNKANLAASAPCPGPGGSRLTAAMPFGALDRERRLGNRCWSGTVEETLNAMLDAAAN